MIEAGVPVHGIAGDGYGRPMLSVAASRPLTVVALTFVAAGLVSCGSDSPSVAAPTTSTTPVQLNTQTVASAIKKSIKDQRSIKAHVVCPSPIVQKQGNDFVCKATTKDGTVTDFAVQQTDDQGHVTYAAATAAGTTP